MLKQRLDQRQIQKLILAPALQQAIKLLPLTNLEVVEVINEELAENPMLELEEENDDGTSVSAVSGEGDAGEDGAGNAEGFPGEGDVPAELGGDAERDEFEAYFEQFFDDGFRSYSPERKEAPSLENTLSRSPSLWDHLSWQANLTFFDPEDKKVAETIIGNINEDGFLTQTEEETAHAAGADIERVRRVRTQVKMFDPVGAGSLDLKEALLAQMDDLGLTDLITRDIVANHLGLLEKSDYALLAKTLGIPLSEIRVHIEVIKRLDPAPGRKHTQERTTYVVPDIIVDKEGEEWKVSLSNEGLPRLRLNAYYRRLLRQASRSNQEAYRFLKDKLKKALWFLRSLEQRDRTISRVARYIVDRQKEFFEKGLDFIRPLTLMEIAQEIGVHESTVGRVVANKHLVSPEGVFPLKYFFHKSLSGDMGEEISSLMVKDRIRKLVENEDRLRPLSDMEIEEILARQGLKIARRTVAKYRQQLNLAPSHIRRRKSMMEECNS
ncbi:MAG: RNA polymerase factor sigma-54 [Candidatus Aminicenantes bacterium]|nr:RNA polymerase factor sigma-54 [Candidatus Aminicenantes bacterium]